MSDHPILESVEQLHLARLSENTAAEALATARAQLERMKAIRLATAYQSGVIDGKNEQSRKAQEAEILATFEPVQKAEADLRLAESKHAADRIEREYREDRYHAFRALLAARTGESVP